ncbi:MAG: YkvA family protein [Alphaproteobacteria bacterium]
MASLKEKIVSISQRLTLELQLYKNVLRDKRTPFLAKLFLGMSVWYLLLPFDLIPDFIPIIGHLDDAVIVPLLIYMALKLTPPEIINEHRILLKNIQNELK